MILYTWYRTYVASVFDLCAKSSRNKTHVLTASERSWTFLDADNDAGERHVYKIFAAYDATQRGYQAGGLGLRIAGCAVN